METLDTYLTELASSSATPGGGSAAMFVASAGAALVAMVCRISAENPKYASHKEAAERIVDQADTLRKRFIEARGRDEAAFDAVVDARRLPKSSDSDKAERKAALEDALHHAAAVPLELCSKILRALQLAAETLEIENRNLISDIGCAAEFFSAALRACAYNVRINHRYMKEHDAISAQSQELQRIEREADLQVRRIRAAVDAALT
ncbi:MAG: cyclodeaminase/cyclohydrolase family protein [Candidatus Baltobacteraceae bacterium]